jgi:hypothetical protein
MSDRKNTVTIKREQMKSGKCRSDRKNKLSKNSKS